MTEGFALPLAWVRAGCLLGERARNGTARAARGGRDGETERDGEREERKERTDPSLAGSRFSLSLSLSLSVRPRNDDVTLMHACAATARL